MAEVVSYLLLPLLIGAAGGFAVAAAGRRWRWPLILMWLASPLLLYTAWMAFTPAAEGGFWGWWAAGIIMLVGPLFGWIAGASAAFAAALRRSSGARG
jgi:hypothetical protein